MKKLYKLKSIDKVYLDVEFTFDYKIQLFSGKDASMLQDMLDESKKKGWYEVPPPTSFIGLPAKVNEEDLGYFLSYHWDVFGQLLPDDEHAAAVRSNDIVY